MIIDTYDAKNQMGAFFKNFSHIFLQVWDTLTDTSN